MTLTADGTSFRERLNVNQPTTVADKLCTVYLGALLRALGTHLYGKAPAASPYQLATLWAVVLDDFAKAGTVSRAYSRAGTYVGELTPVAYGTTPASGQIAVAPNGDLVTLAADAITILDAHYSPRKYDASEVTLPVVPGTGILTLPPAQVAVGVVDVFEVEALAGTATGKKNILVPGTAPAAGQARLNLAKNQILFATADAVTSARVKYGFAPAYDLDAQLRAVSPMY